MVTKNNRIIKCVVICVLILALPTIVCAEEIKPAAQLSTSKVTVAWAKPCRARAVKLQWLPVNGATRYSVFGGMISGTSAGYKTLDNDITKTGCTIKRISGKKLKSHALYHFYVNAYKGKKLISKSKEVFVITKETYKKKYGNVTKIKMVGESNITVDLHGDDVYLPETLPLVYKGKKHISSKYGNKVRYTVEKRNILEIRPNGGILKQGIIVPIKPGKTRVFIQAINGMYQVVNIEVKE